MFYSQMVACGATTIPEDVTATGRIDLTAIAENRTYVFEFKVLDGDTGDGSALQQINDRHYSDKYCDGREVYKVSIEFSRQQRNIIGFDWKRVE